MESKNYELVLCIVNAGFSDEIMKVAKEAGAKGGTVIRGRGTANPDAEEKFHIVVQPDKEIVLIVVQENIKDDVLTAIYTNAGLETPSQGIAFSVPVTRAVGMND